MPTRRDDPVGLTSEKAVAKVRKARLAEDAKAMAPKDPIIGISHGRTYSEHRDQPIEYEAATPLVPIWVWMLGLCGLILAAATYGAVNLAHG